MIPSYKPGPVTALAPEPPAHTVPRMIQQGAIKKLPVWRVQEAEFNELQWLPQRLGKEYPNLSVDGLFSWMRAAINDRLTLFIRSTKIVGLFNAETTVLNPGHPTVRERWVRSSEKDNEEACLFYRYARDWAASIGAAEFVYDLDSDCSMTMHVNPVLSDVKKNFTIKKSTIYSVVMLE